MSTFETTEHSRLSAEAERRLPPDFLLPAVQDCIMINRNRQTVCLQPERRETEKGAQTNVLLYDWNKEFQNVGLVWEPKIVRVLNDDALDRCFFKAARKQSYALSAHARAAYQERYGAALQITEKSLACEIYWHYVIRKVSLWMEKRWGRHRLTGWLLYHMDVIDCGEKAVDNNRFLWDLLSVLF